jgi:hypothetical protein
VATSARTYRQRHDWDTIATYFCSLPPGKRTYGEVARKFGVSEVSVGIHARAERWDDHARGFDEKRRAELEKRSIRSIAERDADTIKLIEAARIRFAQQLRDPAFKISASEMAALVKLERLLEGQPTERVDVAAQVEAKLAGMPEPFLRQVLGALMRSDDVEGFAEEIEDSAER